MQCISSRRTKVFTGRYMGDRVYAVSDISKPSLIFSVGRGKKSALYLTPLFLPSLYSRRLIIFFPWGRFLAHSLISRAKILVGQKSYVIDFSFPNDRRGVRALGGQELRANRRANRLWSCLRCMAISSYSSPVLVPIYRFTHTAMLIFPI